MPIPDENFFELEKYSAMMISHLHWENREHYFELIEKLLNGPMHFLELRKKYQVINDAARNARNTAGGSLFAEGFTPQRQYCSRLSNKPLSCRNNV
jgi:hypothetical protein